MTLEEARKILDAEVIVGADLMSREIQMACGSDLMSDVLSFVKSDYLLLTGLTTDLAAICFVRGKRPDEDTVSIAEAKNIPLLTTPVSMFEACGRLWKQGLRGFPGK